MNDKFDLTSIGNFKQHERGACLVRRGLIIIFLLLGVGIGVFDNRRGPGIDGMLLNWGACLVFVVAGLVPIAFLSLEDYELDIVSSYISRKRAFLVLLSCCVTMVLSIFPISFFTFEFGTNPSIAQMIVMPVMLTVTMATWLLAVTARKGPVQTQLGNLTSLPMKGWRGYLMDAAYNFLAILVALTYFMSFAPFTMHGYGDPTTTIIQVLAIIALFLQFKLFFQLAPRILLIMWSCIQKSGSSNSILVCLLAIVLMAIIHAYTGWSSRLGSRFIDDPTAYSQFIGFLGVYFLTIASASLAPVKKIKNHRALRILSAIGFLFWLPCLAQVTIFEYLFHGMYRWSYYDNEFPWLLFPNVIGLTCIIIFILASTQSIRSLLDRRRQHKSS